MLNVVCVNHANYLGRGGEYVYKLRAGVERNLTVPFRFHVIDDNDVPPGVTGWWSKLVMFQPGRFDGRCLYFDLDTVIAGNIDDIASYSGRMAMVRDWFHPNWMTSSVLAWDAALNTDIWTVWDAVGRPSQQRRGDGFWIECMRPNADKLQDLYPGKLASFKADVDAIESASVVCFHGNPRPHVVRDLMKKW